MGHDTFSPSRRRFKSRCDAWRRVWWLRRFCSWPEQGPIVGFKLKINSKSNFNYWCVAHCVNWCWMKKTLFSLLFIMFLEKIPPRMHTEFLPSPMLSVTQFLKFPLPRQLPETHNTHSGINALEPQLSFGCQENLNVNLSLELLQDLPIPPAALISTLEASESSWTY